MTSTIRVLCLDPLPDTALAVFKNANFQIDFVDGELSEAALCRKVEDYNIICVKQKRAEVYMTDEVIRSAHRLLAIGVFSQWVAGKLVGDLFRKTTCQLDFLVSIHSPIDTHHRSTLQQHKHSESPSFPLRTAIRRPLPNSASASSSCLLAKLETAHGKSTRENGTKCRQIAMRFVARRWVF